MRKQLLAACMIVGSIVGLPATAHASGIYGELNGARASGVWGVEVGLGYSLDVGPITLSPGAGAFIYRGDNTRYVLATFSNGQTRCRDSTNGQFASDEKCDNTAAKAYGRVEATFSLAGTAQVGGGARYSGDKVRPYGLVAVPLAPKITLKGNVGDKYYAVGVHVRF